MLKKLQIWHLICVSLIPALYTIFRISSEPHDTWRQYIDIGIIVLGSVWASLILLQSIIHGQQDWKSNILKAYRAQLTNIRFLAFSNLILTVIVFGLLFQLLMYRQVEFLINRDVDLYLNDAPSGDYRLGSIRKNESIKIRLFIGKRHLVFKSRNGESVSLSAQLHVKPFWSDSRSVEFKKDIEERRVDEILSNNLLTENESVIKMEWGLQNDKAYVEVTEGSFRFFEPREEIQNGDTAIECSARHNQLWKEYLEECKRHSKQTSKEEFERIKNEKDSFCTGYFKEVSPVFYFDFVSNNSSDEYVLESIEIENIGNMLSRNHDGGFVNEEAWYDIVLPMVGSPPKVYKVNRKLVFRGHGRTQLRFWSGHIFPDEGWKTYRCGYSLKVTFRFLANGRYVRVSANPFGIYV